MSKHDEIIAIENKEERERKQKFKLRLMNDVLFAPLDTKDKREKAAAAASSFGIIIIESG